MIAIGCDHGGYKLKEEIKKYLDEVGIEFQDVGTHSEERTDAIIYAKKVVKKVQAHKNTFGILICKSGNMMNIVANKSKGIRCAYCFNEYTVKQAKEHLDCNVIAIPAECVNISEAVKIIRTWIGAEFLGGRYTDRLKMLQEYENNNMK